MLTEHRCQQPLTISIGAHRKNVTLWKPTNNWPPAPAPVGGAERTFVDPKPQGRIGRHRQTVNAGDLTGKSDRAPCPAPVLRKVGSFVTDESRAPILVAIHLAEIPLTL